MSSETEPTGERYGKAVVFDYGIFPSLPSQLCSPLSCGQKERGGESIWVISYIFRLFLGFNVNIEDWRYLMLERELPRLSTNEKRHPPNGILRILQEIKKNKKK